MFYNKFVLIYFRHFVKLTSKHLIQGLFLKENLRNFYVIMFGQRTFFSIIKLAFQGKCEFIITLILKIAYYVRIVINCALAHI